MFTLDPNKTPHMWTARQDIPLLARSARLAAAHVVAQLAVLHKPDGSAAEKRAYEAVEEAVMKLARSELHDTSSNSTSGDATSHTNNHSPQRPHLNTKLH